LSTYFIPDGPLPFDALRAFDTQCVKTHAVHDDGSLLLTDGYSYLWAYPPYRKWPVTFERCGANDPSAIIVQIETTFGIRLVSEHEQDFDKLRKGRTNRSTVLP